MCVFTAAAQNRLSSSVLAFIKVLDINDNVPGLARDYQPYICEGTQAGEVCIFTPAQVYGWLCSSEFEWNWSIKILWKPQGIKSFSFISTRFLAEILETHNCLCTLIYLCINIYVAVGLIHSALHLFIRQVIQLLSAIDADDPVEGHHFYFSMVPDRNINPNFTIRDNQGDVWQKGNPHRVTNAAT